MKKVFQNLSFQATVRPLIVFQGLFGLALFKYPSNFYKTSPKAFLAFIFNLSMLTILAIFLLYRDFDIRQSKVLSVGIQISVKTIMLFCILIVASNYVARKNFFKLLKLFERFDASFEKLTGEQDPIYRANQKVIISMIISWSMQCFYIGFYIEFSNIFIFYQMVFNRLAEEQFMFFCLHLVARMRLLNEASRKMRYELSNSCWNKIVAFV